MAKKAASLFAPQPADEEAPPQQPSTSTAAATVAKAELVKPAYRDGKKAFSTWLNEKAIRQLKAMAAEEGRTVQDLMVEIINKEFARKGKPEIA